MFWFYSLESFICAKNCHFKMISKIEDMTKMTFVCNLVEPNFKNLKVVI